ncbi:murein transglycosylase A [Kordiimonas aestuarii]|uniref:murein transglycosylase A n=1 Tax=Kordiimonas aestuarii TaxID=1005925 RepID=UPI0021D11C81|nr:murein transglycosylase A [Kordiimonas aestuarii]
MAGRALKYIGFLALIALPLVAALLLMSRKPAGLSFRPVPFAELPGWGTDNLMEALPALRKSCDSMKRQPAKRGLPGAAIGGTMGDWAEVCTHILSAGPDDDLRSFFESAFQPLEVSLGGETKGMFTGYYETLLRGSENQSIRYHVPLHVKPPELVSVDLGSFRADLRGRRIAGKVQGDKLVPYYDREAITSGAIDGRDLELLWVDDPVDAFFLHIQGSGRVIMDDGRLVRVGYASQNGHAYTAIGRQLIAEGEVPRTKMSMQAIRSWLDDNPDRAEELLNTNASYVFFRLLEEGDGPFGSANVALTAGRSLAVDRNHLSLHVPVWLSASYPDPSDREAEPLPLNRLMVAQDTGGAIRGEIRGDVFWGFGEEAEEIAGRMANRGRYWIMLPKPLAARLLEDRAGG